MRVLVLSDSHSAYSFMRRCVRALQPDVMIHLGDFFDDGLTLHEDFPQIPFYQVPGNCDCGRAPMSAQQILIQNLGGVNIYMTHGHLHGVKNNTGKLLAAARVSKCDIVLYGHTHQAECYQDDSGLWVMNPGSCGYFGGSAGLMEIADGKITACRIIGEADLSENV